jgi:GR25 family glycosyltransferase involved in LPS biosynthesis
MIIISISIILITILFVSLFFFFSACSNPTDLTLITKIPKPTREGYENSKTSEFYGMVERIETTMLRTDLQAVVHYPVFYINLDRQPEKRQYIESQFAAYNISPFYRVPGVDGKHVQPNEFVSPYEFRDDLKIHQIGCIMAHVRAIEMFYNTCSADIGLIIEDDLNFAPLGHVDFTIPDIVDAAPPDWEIISLHTTSCNHYQDNRSTYNPTICMYRRESVKEYCLSAAAYLIKRITAKYILDRVLQDGVIKIFPLRPGYPEWGVADSYFYSLVPTYYVTPSVVFPYMPDHDFQVSGESFLKSYLNHGFPKLVKPIRIMSI